MMRPLVVVLLTLAWLVTLTPPGFAQTGAMTPLPAPRVSDDHSLVNLDTPALSATHTLDYQVGLRAFTEKEALTYANVGIGYGLSSHCSLLARASLAGRTTQLLSSVNNTAIRHGGTDVELAARYRLRGGGESNSPALAAQIPAINTSKLPPM